MPIPQYVNRVELMHALQPLLDLLEVDGNSIHDERALVIDRGHIQFNLAELPKGTMASVVRPTTVGIGRDAVSGWLIDVEIVDGEPRKVGAV